MAESQSRFSIIEELTNKKVAFKDELGRLDESIKERKVALSRSKVDFERNHTLALEDLERYEGNVQSRKNTLTEQITDIENAVKAIQGMSTKE